MAGVLYDDNGEGGIIFAIEARELVLDSGVVDVARDFRAPGPFCRLGASEVKVVMAI